jgi:hypothetical protein
LRRFRGTPDIRERALAVLGAPHAEFWYSPILRLELILQPTYHQKTIELEFYATYFGGANCYGAVDRIFEVGQSEAMKYGIPVLDALHIAAAHLAKCKLLLTTESRSKPMFRTTLVKVVNIAATARNELLALGGSSKPQP